MADLDRSGSLSALAVVADEELRDLWVGGRALVLITAYSLFLSVLVYLLAANSSLNFLEQRESLSLTAQLAIAVGGLLTVIVAADAISGERERRTLESVLVSPAPRRSLVAGKLLAALSLWLACFAVAVPYIWFLGNDVGLVASAVACTLCVGTLLALSLACFGMTVSIVSPSNRISLSLSLFVLLALLAPTQLPPSTQAGWAGESLARINPLTAGEHYVGRVLTDGHPWQQDVSWLVSPAIAAGVLLVVVLTAGASLSLEPRSTR